MRHTTLFKKILKEVISVLSIVLFIYTCTKVGSAAVNRKKSSTKDTVVHNNTPVTHSGAAPSYFASGHVPAKTDTGVSITTSN